MQVTTISDYYRSRLDQLRGEVVSTRDDRVLGMELEGWLQYLERKYSLERVDIDEGRTTQMFEVEVERTLRGYDIYSDAGPGTIRVTQMRVTIPVIPSETLQTIWRHSLAPNTFFMAKYPRFEYEHQAGTMSAVVGLDPTAVRGAVDDIKAELASYNASIADENRAFRSRVVPIVEAHRAQIAEKHAKLDSLAAAVGIPLTKRSDPAKVVPSVPRVRQQIAPVMPPVAKRQERPVLDATAFKAILELVDNQCRGFERTPQAYSVLTEEGLRDIILGSLNAVFEGAAGGETFQGVGKVDIHLRIAQGEVFLAEVKFWDGQASLHETVGQLLSRLTWRDSYGVAILLSRNVGFGEVLGAITTGLPGVSGFASGSMRKVDHHHSCARFAIPSDPSHHAEVHVLGFNLYAKELGKRQVRRPRKQR